MAATMRRAGGADWQLLRAIRLEALAEAPMAFGSTLAREEPLVEEDWRRRIETAQVYLALDTGAVVGTATGFTDPVDPGTVVLVGMYVRARARGTGVADQLVDAVVAGAREAGAGQVVLRVASTNPRAHRLYERHGFATTGRRSTLGHTPSIDEVELVLALV